MTTNKDIPLVVRNEYLPKQYDLKLDINPGKTNFNGELKFEIETNELFTGDRNNKGFEMTLHAYKLVVLSATIDIDNGSQIAKLSVDNDIKSQTVGLRLDNQNGSSIDKATVVIKYIGTINTIKTFQQQTCGIYQTNYLDSVSNKSDNIIIATQTQPIFARRMFPVIDELMIKIPVKLTLETLSRFKAVSNSDVDSVVRVNDDYSQFNFKPTLPLLVSNFGFVVGDMECSRVVTNDIPIGVYSPIGEINDFQLSLDVTSKLLPLAQQKLGAFPLPKLDFVALPFLTEGAMENWGLVTVVKSYLSSSMQSIKHIKQLIAHELVHQWLGDWVSFDDWKYLWLNESFATFIGNDLVTRIDGDYDDTIDDLMATSFNQLQRGKETNIQKFMNQLTIDNDINTSYLFDNDVYEKGILLLRMINNLIGENGGDDNTDVMYEGLRHIIDTYKFKSIKPMEIWKVFDQQLKFDLLAFINSWIRYDGYPIIEVSQSDDKKLVLEQTQAKIFQLPLFIKSTNGIIQKTMVQKHMKLDISSNNLLTINTNQIAFADVKVSKELIKAININKLNKFDTKMYLNQFDSGEMNRKLKGHLRACK